MGLVVCGRYYLPKASRCSVVLSSRTLQSTFYVLHFPRQIPIFSVCTSISSIFHRSMLSLFAYPLLVFCILYGTASCWTWACMVLPLLSFPIPSGRLCLVNDDNVVLRLDCLWKSMKKFCSEAWRYLDRPPHMCGSHGLTNLTPCSLGSRAKSAISND